jgi:hypothetical protein
MKKVFLVIGFWFVVSLTSLAQDDLQLEDLIKKTKSEKMPERVLGFEAIASYWDRRPHITASFSDTPTEDKVPQPQKPEITDANLDKIAEAIKRGVNDSSEEVRKAAAIAMCYAPRSSDAVQAALLVCIKSDDATVNWYARQQRTEVWPKVELVIEDLIEDLSSQDFSKYDSASDLLQHYGEGARQYSDRIAQVIFKGENDEDRALKFYVFCDIGLTEDAIRTLTNRAGELSEEESAIVALAMLEQPDALRLLKAQHPNLIRSIVKHNHRLFEFLCKHQHEPHETRDWLISEGSLTPNIMGMLREPRFIEEITKLEANASNHEKTFLHACKRACGAKADLIIDVDSKHPVEFRPASAWPNIDNRRLSQTVSGHGDGLTFAMVTGEIRGADGSHPKTVSFYRTNDAMLLGTKMNYSMPLLYAPEKGRFVFYTSVFAAFSLGDNQPEPGPYQTGSALIRVEASGFKPIVVQFFDEMPDIRVTLDKEE